jgi:conjugal transfer mating pair stabilization protein TraN
MRRCLFAGFLLLWSLLAWPAPDCRKVSDVCVAPGQTRQISGMSVYRDCWEYRATYECRSPHTINDCQALRDKGCASIGARCIERANDGSCASTEQTFQCPDKPEKITQRTVCDPQSFCQDGAKCFDTNAPADKDFAHAAVMMEASREAGVYGIDPNKIEIFKGFNEQCSIKVLGGAEIKSCCKSQGGGGKFSNYSMLGAGMKVAGEGAREGVKLGSKYVYDALYAKMDTALVKKGLSAMNGWASTLGDGVFNPSFNFYGFSFQFSFANGFQMMSFDPYTFGLQVGMMLIQQWLSCDQSEQVMSLKRGQNLCVHTETQCTQKVLGVCLEKKQRHCCFNSKLAKLINRQGRAQLGKSPSGCEGFTQDELQRLDFSVMDFSEFLADVMPKEPDVKAWQSRANQSVNQESQRMESLHKGSSTAQEKIRNYYER